MILDNFIEHKICPNRTGVKNSINSNDIIHDDTHSNDTYCEETSNYIPTNASDDIKNKNIQNHERCEKILIN